MVTLLHSVPLRSLFFRETDDDEIEIVVYEATGNATNSDDDVRVATIQLGVIRSTHTAVNNKDCLRASVFYTYIAYKGKNYKLIDWLPRQPLSRWVSGLTTSPPIQYEFS